MAPRTITFFSAAVLLVAPAFSQGRGGSTGSSTGTGAGSTGTGTGTGSTGTGSPTIGTPGTRLPPTTPSQTQQQPTMPPQPIMVSGRVLLEDGTAPPESLVIERVCGGQAHSEGYTDTKGYFALELGRSHGVLQDASESSTTLDGFGASSSNPGSFGSQGGSTGTISRGVSPEMRFMGCDLRARLAGYRSQVIPLTNRRPLDNPDVGIILLHRIGPNEGGTVSAGSLAAPKDARKAYEKGMDAIKKKKLDDALKSFQRAVELYPTYALAHYELGRLQAGKDDLDSARKSYEAAMKGDPRFLPPYLEVAVMEAQAKRWQELADITEQAAKLDSFDYPQVFFLNAVANYNLKNFAAAEKSARNAERLDTRHLFPKNHQLLGVLLAQKQDYEGAAERLRAYLKFAPTGPDVDQVRRQLDQIEKLSNPNAQVKEDK